MRPEHIRMFHDMALKEFGGLPGEHEPSLIDSLAYKPFQIYNFGGHTYEPYPGLFMKAAVYMHTLSSNQYFVDGNKRTAYITAASFLELNGYVVVISDWELYFASKLVANKKWSLETLAGWLEINSVPESQYTEDMEPSKETLLQLYKEYIDLLNELEIQEILTEEEVEERKELQKLLDDMQ
ncbi:MULTISPECIES: type II toxin-antitoxin system death-on-curing family toxin [Anoxybacillus]|uniref:Type II toxin-antitoxin system death-on-curing family toxin n=1 Tax=Anoxybacteroides rupiense TaxID=311460 RepID=A0ABD5IYB7_9BACL|nr:MULTISPECIES: type II toxin-antitoxin system death-on-curing family toxin [Anoxybacillus]MDE8565738.1 type II toxin-antitoxin system death-on-curing family toxin [Anoxybacillus rupiensis]MED5052967.1 type II toxin-antitoxin system death-on-curing family toxin [Anoxybacillus rupiensis]